MILQSRRVWIINDWLRAQVEISASSGRIEGIYPYGRMALTPMTATRRDSADGFLAVPERE